MKYQKVMILFLWLLLLGGCGNKETVLLEEITEVSGEEMGETANKELSEIQDEDLGKGTTELIYVYVCGAVKTSGVFELKKDGRVCDAIEAAGGFCEDAAREYVNLARKLEDEEQIYIPTKEEAETQEILKMVTKEKEEESSLININTADEQTLCTLPGVGKSRARAIISYREQKGNFQSIEEIMNVEGIKNGLFEKIEAFITVQ